MTGPVGAVPKEGATPEADEAQPAHDRPTRIDRGPEQGHYQQVKLVLVQSDPLPGCEDHEQDETEKLHRARAGLTSTLCPVRALR